jgi:uncharacterized protein with GYD domain
MRWLVECNLDLGHDIYRVGDDMSRYIITGSYTSAAVKGMIAKPSDRAQATSALVKAAGGKLESYYLTTGDHDFSMLVTTDDLVSMLAALMVAGASGAVTGLKTVQAFTSDEFLDAQKKAGKIANKYKAPN